MNNKIFHTHVERPERSRETTVIKLPPTKQIITACMVLHGKKVKFHQDTTGITLNLATVQFDSLVTRIEMFKRSA